MDLVGLAAGLAKAVTIVVPAIEAVAGLVSRLTGRTPKEEEPEMTEAQKRNQRQETSAGAARNYSSRMTERAAHEAKAKEAAGGKQ